MKKSNKVSSKNSRINVNHDYVGRFMSVAGTDDTDDFYFVFDKKENKFVFLHNITAEQAQDLIDRGYH